jgi:hypothetical protein
MIIEPDFLTHWKTKALIAELNDPAAPLYVLAIWAYCQQRKTDRIPNDNPNVTKSIAGFSGDAELLISSMERSGFVHRHSAEHGEFLHVHGFREANSKLFSNWENGTKGGRPKNPKQTQSEPNGNPTITDKIDKIRIDKIKIPPKSPKGECESSGVPTMAEWLEYATEIGYPKSEASRAWNYYDSAGWMIGKNRPIKRWRSCVQTCFQNWKDKTQKAESSKSESTDEFIARLQNIY